MMNKLSDLLENVLGEDFAVLENMENFKESESWDSLAYVNLVMSMESEFGIKLKKEDIQELFSVARIKAILIKYGVKGVDLET